MNRIIFFTILLGLIFIDLKAQKISVDRIEADGTHQIMTNTEDFVIGGTKYSFGMKVLESSFSKEWFLLISSFLYISDYTNVLLKLGNGDIVYLPVNNVHVGKVTMPSYGVTIGTITSITPSTQADYYSSVYELKEEDMNKIDIYGISKIRISNGVEYFDKKYRSNSLGKFLTKCRKSIKKRLDNPLKSGDIFDDF